MVVQILKTWRKTKTSGSQIAEMGTFPVVMGPWFVDLQLPKVVVVIDTPQRPYSTKRRGDVLGHIMQQSITQKGNRCTALGKKGVEGVSSLLRKVFPRMQRGCRHAGDFHNCGIAGHRGLTVGMVHLHFRN